MGNRASGTFEVSFTPHAPEEGGNGNGNDLIIGRMAIEKKFDGDLAATSKVQMLSIGTKVKDSALRREEWVSGILNGAAAVSRATQWQLNRGARR